MSSNIFANVTKTHLTIMIKTFDKKFNTAKEYLEEEIRLNGSQTFEYDFDEDGRCYIGYFSTSDNMKQVDNAKEMIDIAVKHLEKYGEVKFKGWGGINSNDEPFGFETYECAIDKTPRATMKDSLQLYCYYSEHCNLENRARWAEGSEKMEIDKKDRLLAELYFGVYDKYDWRDEMFRKRGLVGLRNIDGKILVPLGNYNFIHGCDYLDDEALAIASKDNKYGLIKRDGTGTVVIPFEYFNINRSMLGENAFIAYEMVDDCMVQDIIIDGRVIANNVHINSYIEQNTILYFKEDTQKWGALVRYRGNWYHIDDQFDRVRFDCLGDPIIFEKNGVEGVVTIDNMFIDLDEWEDMTYEESYEFWERIVGCWCDNSEIHEM